MTSLKRLPESEGAVSGMDPYKYDLSMVVNNMNKSNLLDNYKNYNKNIRFYLDKRNEINKPNVNPSEASYRNELDEQMIMALKSNNKFAKDVMQHNENKANQIRNYFTYWQSVGQNFDAVKEIMDNDNIKMGTDISNIEQDINNKKRHLEINQYYNAKYEKQQKIIRNMVILLSIMILLSAIFKIGLLPEKLFVALIGTIFAIMFIYFVYESLNIYFRDSRNFDEYTYLANGTSGHGMKKDVVDEDIHLYLQNDLPGFCDIMQSTS